MARTRNHLEQISEDFEQLDSMTQADLVCELFARLAEAPKLEAWRRIQFGAKMLGLSDTPLKRKPRGNGAEVPPLMPREEVEAAGRLALEPAKGGKQ